jgi:hypothetical protein
VSTGIRYSVEIDSPAPASDLDALLDTVDSVAEIPKSIRAGATVERAQPGRRAAAFFKAPSWATMWLRTGSWRRDGGRGNGVGRDALLAHAW